MSDTIKILDDKLVELIERLQLNYDFESDSVMRLFNELFGAVQDLAFIQAAEICLYLSAKDKTQVKKVMDAFPVGERSDGNKV